MISLADRQKVSDVTLCISNNAYTGNEVAKVSVNGWGRKPTALPDKIC